jgi:hypothetical protein
VKLACDAPRKADFWTTLIGAPQSRAKVQNSRGRGDGQESTLDRSARQASSQRASAGVATAAIVGR